MDKDEPFRGMGALSHNCQDHNKISREPSIYNARGVLPEWNKFCMRDMAYMHSVTEVSGVSPLKGDGVHAKCYRMLVHPIPPNTDTDTITDTDTDTHPTKFIA